MSEPERYRLDDDGTFPNSRHAALVHRGVAEGGPDEIVDRLEQMFAANGWAPEWRDGIYSFHHYHSTAHEVLGVFAGSVTVRLGGPEGTDVDLSAGDVVVIPAGVGHCNRGSDALQVTGGYADGRSWDLLRGEPGDRPQADENIAAVPDPELDPVTGRAITWDADA